MTTPTLSPKLSQPDQPGPANRWTLPVLLAGTVMIILDFFVVNVALPSMQASLHAGPSTLMWVVSGYSLGFASLIITGGRLGDRFGRRWIFTTGLVLFGATSALCGVAPGAAVLIAARTLQGASAALISPAILAIIGVAFPGAARTKAITAYAMAMGVAAAGGQLVGGLLIQADVAGLAWRSIFLINVPIAVVAALAAVKFIPESKGASGTRFDWSGVGLVTAGLVALVLPLVQGQELGWPAWTWISLAAAPFLLAAFATNQRRQEQAGRQPILPPSLFASRALRSGLVTQLAFWCGQASLFLVLALYLQQGRGLSPLTAGAVFTILAMAYLVASMKSSVLTARFGRGAITIGAVLLSAGEGALAAAVGLGGAHVNLWALVPGFLAAGAGMGFCIPALTTVVMSHCQPERAGALSGALSTVQQVGNSIGVAVTGVVYFTAVHAGAGHAFAISAVQLSALLLAVAGISRRVSA